MAVADVPVREVGRFDASCSDCHAILVLCLVLALDVLHDLLHQGGGVLVVEKESSSLHWFVVHVLIIGATRGSVVPPCASSQFGKHGVHLVGVHVIRQP